MIYDKPVSDNRREPEPRMPNINDMRSFLELAGENYSKSAPALADWIDDIYIRMGEDLSKVTLLEVAAFSRLWVRCNDEWCWEHPHYAQNTIYKIRASLGMEVGVCSY